MRLGLCFKFSTQINDEASRQIDLIDAKINLTKLKLNAKTETNEEFDSEDGLWGDQAYVSFSE